MISKKIPNGCYDCQCRSRSDLTFCNNYLLPLKDAKIKCNAEKAKIDRTVGKRQSNL